MSNKIQKNIVRILIALSCLAAIKMVFAGIERDETYAISMAYRMTQGDRLLKEMWESHQTSALLMAVLIKIFLMIFNTTTGIVIYLRLISLLIMLSVAYVLFCVMRDMTDRESALCGALLFFNVAPKEYVLAEFSCMQMWFSTLLILALMRAEMNEGIIRNKYLIVSGIAMSCLVLSYPSCVIIFPCICVVLWVIRKDGKGILVFGVTCVVLAGLFVGCLLGYMDIMEMVHYAKLLVKADATHQTSDIGALYFMGFAIEQLKVIALLYAIGCAILFFFLYYRKKNESQVKHFGEIAVCCLLLVGAVVHLLVLFWPTESNWVSVYMHMIIIFVAGLLFELKNHSLQKSWPIYLIGIGVLISTVLVSNLSILNSMMYMISGVACALSLMFHKLKTEEKVARVAKLAVYSVVFATIISKGYLLGQSSVLKTTVFDVAGIIRRGPAAGIVADYMTAYMFNSNYEEFQMYLRPGDKVMIANDTTIDYLDVRDLEVCVSSTISSPTYDENLLKYWEINPDKFPEVVVVDCWFGETRYPTGTWLGDWLTNDFCAEQIVDGKYFRYYIKRRG